MINNHRHSSDLKDGWAGEVNACCRRQFIELEVCSGDQSAQSAEKFFRRHFSIRMTSRGTFVLCTASSKCTRIAGRPGAAMCFFIAQISLTNVIGMYT